MSLLSSCYQCTQPANVKCLHCEQKFCRLHFRQHEETISYDIHSLTDRLNNLIENNLHIEEHKQLLIDELYQWQQASHRIIDDYCQMKYHEIDKKVEEYSNKCHETLKQIKNQMKTFLSNECHIIIDEQRETYENKLNELENMIKENRPCFHMNSLYIDPKLISFTNESSISSLLDLKIPKRTCQIKFDASPIAANGKFLLLQDTRRSLGLYDSDTLLLHRHISLSSTDSSNIVDLHWSCRLEQFLILTRNYLFALNHDLMINNILRKSSKEFRTLTSNDNHDELFLATSTSIEAYSLSTFNFFQRFNINDRNIYSLRFNSNTDQFGLTVRTYDEHKWYFEVRNRSMTRLWSIATPIECGSCTVSILFNCNQWIVVNIHGDILFQVTNDNHIKSEVIYGGRTLLNAIENEKFLIIRTFGYLEQYEL